MDGILLEGQERPGRRLEYVIAFSQLIFCNQLFARRGSLPESDKNIWTTFEMALREPTQIPAAFDFTRFLVSSITFMAHLSEVSVYFDDKRLVRLTKDIGIPKQMSLPQGLKTLSTQGYMKVKEIKTTRAYYIILDASELCPYVLFSAIHQGRSYELGLYCGHREASTNSC